MCRCEIMDVGKYKECNGDTIGGMSRREAIFKVMSSNG